MGEPVLSQRRDLLEQPLDFYEPDDLPATQRVITIIIIQQFLKAPQHVRVTTRVPNVKALQENPAV